MLNPLAFESFKAKAIACLALLMAGVMLALACVAWVHRYGQRQADAARAQTQARYEAAISTLKAEASAMLAAETNKTLDAERKLHAAETAIEEMGHARQALSQDIQRRIDAAAARNGGRLRDPSATGCGPGGGGTQGTTAAATNTGAADPAQGGGLLSLSVSDLLRRLVREGQEQADAYAVCRQDALSIRGQ